MDSNRADIRMITTMINTMIKGTPLPVSNRSIARADMGRSLLGLSNKDGCADMGLQAQGQTTGSTRLGGGFGDLQ